MQKVLTDGQGKVLCFVICYFGILPDTLPITLKTIAENPGYNWLLFTDDTRRFKYPQNVRVCYSSFQKLRERIQKCFDFPIALETPKKLCDFKPAYGYIFEEELHEYEFWGYCDLDQYFGCLKKYIPHTFLCKYDKIFSLGHMTIYRNTDKMRMLFMSSLIYFEKIDEIKNYRDVFSRRDNCVFDEWPRDRVNINILAEQKKIRCCYEGMMLDILPYRSCFQSVFFDAKKHEWMCNKRENLLIYWDNGSIYSLQRQEKSLKKKEYAYVHIQKRKLQIFNSMALEKCGIFLIYPNKILLLKKYIDVSAFFFLGKAMQILQLSEKKKKIFEIFFTCKYKFRVIYERLFER